MKNDNFDNITQILKSISPFKNTFAQESKKFDKSFKYSSLDNLVKSLDVKYVYKDQFEPDPEIVLHKNDYNVNFQNSYDYLDELSDVNNLPLVLQNKNCIKDGDFNPDYENDINKKEINKKYIKEEEGKRKKERLRKRIERLKKFRDSDSNIDPGKYHPNYDAIKRRYPCVYIRDPNIHIKDSWLINCPFRNTFEEFKRLENEKKENLKKINANKKENNQNIKNQNQNLNNNNISKNDLNNNNNVSIINKISSFNSNENSPRSISTNEINKEKSEEDSLSSKAKNLKVKNIIPEKLKKLSLPMIINSPRNHNVSNISNISKVFSPKKRVSRSVSYENIFNNNKSPINFNKMKGRENLFVESKYLISYNPNYDSTFPHVPSSIFK